MISVRSEKIEREVAAALQLMQHSVTQEHGELRHLLAAAEAAAGSGGLWGL